MRSLLSATLILCLFLTACGGDNNSNNDDVKTKVVDKNGSVEVTLRTNHIDSLRDLLITHYIVWNKGSKAKEFDVRDTIPALGKTVTEAENDNGETKNVTVPKDYDFFVTVK